MCADKFRDAWEPATSAAAYRGSFRRIVDAGWDLSICIGNWATVLIASHNPAVDLCADRVYHLQDGKLAAVGE
jgi:hypothetical protein